MGNIGAENMTLEQEIARQITDGAIVLERLKNEDKHLSGEVVGSFGYEYDTGLMFDQILERHYDRWRSDLAAIDDPAEQQRYYNTVIYPRIRYLEWRVNDRHAEQRDGRELETMRLCDDNLGDLTDMVYAESPGDLHELVEDASLCRILKRLTPAQKEVLYTNAVLEYSVQDIAAIKNTTNRNILKTKDTALIKIRGQYLPVVMFKYKVQTDGNYSWLFVRGISTTFGERHFAATLGEEYVDYYDGMAFDFVPIIKDYRTQARRINDRKARLRDEKRRRKERELPKLIVDGNMISDGQSYGKDVTTDYAQDI